MDRNKIVIGEYVDVRYTNSYKKSRNITDKEISKRSSKFSVPIDASRVSKILNGGKNCELDTLIRLCYCSGMTPNDIVAGDWNSPDIEILKKQMIKLQNDKTFLKDELIQVKKEIKNYKRLDHFLRYKGEIK